MEKIKDKSIKEQIREYVVDRIANGEWSLKSRIPTRVEFEEKFSTTAVTVNSALRPLVTEGFLQANGKSGTYVHPNPPPFDHYALIFPEIFDDRKQPPNFWRALKIASKNIEKKTGITFQQYMDFSPHVDNPSYLKLSDDLKYRRLAGIIYGNWPYGMEKSELFGRITVPMLAIVSHFVAAKVKTLRFDGHALFSEMAEILKQRGSVRPAVIIPSLVQKYYQDFKTAFAESGISTPMEFVQFVNYDTPWAAEHIVRLLFRLPPQDRPDGILIGDDNLIEAVMKGLITILGKKAAAEFPIATHVNFPLSDKALLPGVGVGFNLEDMLLSMINEMSSPEQNVTASSYMIRPVSQSL